jgi:hypothetical protein
MKRLCADIVLSAHIRGPARPDFFASSSHRHFNLRPRVCRVTTEKPEVRSNTLIGGRNNEGK